MNFEMIYKTIEKYVKDNYGPPCDEFEINCGICQQYLALSILQNNIAIEASLKAKGVVN